jgi:chemotaxis receptor (MCP) glutamine deamidase CheD
MNITVINPKSPTDRVGGDTLPREFAQDTCKVLSADSTALCIVSTQRLMTGSCMGVAVWYDEKGEEKFTHYLRFESTEEQDKFVNALKEAKENEGIINIEVYEGY